MEGQGRRQRGDDPELGPRRAGQNRCRAQLHEPGRERHHHQPEQPDCLRSGVAWSKMSGILVVATDPRSPRPMPSMSASTRPTGRVSPKQWLAKALGGKGNALTINGMARHPANKMRVTGCREVFGQCQLGLGARPADHAEPAGNMSDIKDVWVQNGMAAGA